MNTIAGLLLVVDDVHLGRDAVHVLWPAAHDLQHADVHGGKVCEHPEERDLVAGPATRLVRRAVSPPRNWPRTSSATGVRPAPTTVASGDRFGWPPSPPSQPRA